MHNLSDPKTDETLHAIRCKTIKYKQIGVETIKNHFYTPFFGNLRQKPKKITRQLKFSNDFNKKETGAIYQSYYAKIEQISA